ncbi:hypothetical protein JTE90_011951 [Oedothorax gibbosus]|uniref:Uncharacterized protein n=1 Tax=Oedothorax gibbosus TaxID=931172 RepID=A0AAV6V0D7_9ARAC|nr:hypothetical protein JTE90_011951 [Oedothorax gibbosus]
MDFSSVALVTAAVIAASVIGVLSIFLIAFFCLMEAEEVPHEPQETDELTRDMSPIPGCSTSESTHLVCTAV